MWAAAQAEDRTQLARDLAIGCDRLQQLFAEDSQNIATAAQDSEQQTNAHMGTRLGEGSDMRDKLKRVQWDPSVHAWLPYVIEPTT
ncbi:hypothetical protein K474DRAFT_1339269 [Panus rudis PR-1116 ss-1]|nr:hypothetical protein K474DRAFT_1339269 [Panus rudis PR-1116 ss-1]